MELERFLFEQRNLSVPFIRISVAINFSLEWECSLIGEYGLRAK